MFSPAMCRPCSVSSIETLPAFFEEDCAQKTKKAMPFAGIAFLKTNQ